MCCLTSINKSKRRYREEKPRHFVFRKRVLFTLGLGLTTPYSMGLLVWKFYQTFVIVYIEFWLRFELQIRPTRFSINFLLITARVERNVRLCVKLFDFFPRWILIRLTWNLSCPEFWPYSYVEFQEKIIPGQFFWNFMKNQGYPLAKFVKFRPTLCNFMKNCVEKFTQVLSCVVCTLRRRHVHKQITKRRYREKSQDNLFSKNRCCSLSVWLLLRPIPWVFCSENFTRHSSLCVLSFGWDLSSRFVAQDFQEIFLFINAWVEKKVRLCVRLFDFFPSVNTHPFDVKFVSFFPKFSPGSYVELK